MTTFAYRFTFYLFYANNLSLFSSSKLSLFPYSVSLETRAKQVACFVYSIIDSFLRCRFLLFSEV